MNISCFVFLSYTRLSFLQITHVLPESYDLSVIPAHFVFVITHTSSDAGLTAISYLIMLILFSRQSERSRTPSGISRVSRWTFLVQSTMDSVSFAGHITFAILAEGRPSLSLIAPAFLACLVFIHEAVSFVDIFSGMDD